MTTGTTTPWWKKRQVIGLAAVVMVSGAIVAGVLGSRAKTQHNHSEPEAIKVQSEPQNGFFKVLDSLFGEKASAATTGTPEIPSTSTAGSTVIQSELQVPSSGVGPAVEEEAKDDGSLLFAVQKQATDAMVDSQRQAAKTLTVLAAASTGASFCYPKMAQELHDAIDNGKCTIIALDSGEYKLHMQLVISRPIIIIGNPVILPELDGHANERIFHVVAGGFLEVRFVRLQQGVGRMIERPIRPIHLRFGTVALVELGGRLHLSGCTIETRAQSVASFLKELGENFTQQRLTIGGYVAVRGGTVDITGCTIWRFRPLGNPNFFEISVGRDVLVIAGTANLAGLFSSSAQLFRNRLAAGGNWCVLGGNMIITGAALNTLTAANSQFGTGLQLYVGGGNAILTGVSRFSASVVLVRGGFGLISNSAGNTVITGYTQMSARGVSADFGTARFSVGAGTLTGVGTALYSVHIARTMHVAGGHWFNGAGVINIIGNVRSNMGTSTNQMGIGLHICNVAGVVSVVGASSYTVVMARSQFAYATDTFIAAGFLSFIRVFRYRNIGAGLFIGKGNQNFVGRGAAVFIRCRQAARILIDWRTTRNVYTIAGTGTGRAGANTNIYMDASGRYSLGSLGFNATKRELSHLPMFRRLQTQVVDPNKDLIFPRSFLLAVDDKSYRGQMVVPTSEQIDAEASEVTLKAFPGLTFFKAAEKISPLDTSHNVLQISAKNTDCLACDVPKEQLVGDSPCVPSQCVGKSVNQVISSDETPKGLQEFASRYGWTNLDGSAAAATTSQADGTVAAADEANIADAMATEGTNADHVERALQLAESTVNRPNVWVLEGEFTVYCDNTVSATGGNSACGQSYREVRTALAYTLGDVNGAASKFSVSAWDKVAAIKPELKEFIDLDELVGSLEASPLDGFDDAAWSTFGFTVTVTDETVRAEVSKAVNNLIADASLLLGNIDFLDTSLTAYHGIKLSRTNTLVIPGNPIGLTGDQLLQGARSPAIVAAVPNSFNGLHEAKIGETYDVSIANFLAGTTVEVNILDTRTKEVVPETTAIQIKVPITKAKTVTASWSLPVGLVIPAFAEGETNKHVFILEASAPGIILKPQSSAFAIVAR